MCNFQVCPGRRVDGSQIPGVSRKASRCLQRFMVCQGRIVDSKKRPGVSREEIMRERERERERLHCCSQTTVIAIGEERESNADW